MSEARTIDLRTRDADELILAQHVALLLGDIPGPLPDWYRRTVEPKLVKGQCRPTLDARQEKLVRLVAEVKARREAVPALPAAPVEVEDEWEEEL